MSWLLGLAATWLSFQAIQLLYAVLQGVIGRRCGAVVEEIALGLGPTIIRITSGGVHYDLRLIPLGSATKFLGMDESADEPETELEVPKPGTPFNELSISSCLVIASCGPAFLLAMGFVITSVPVWIGASQLVIDGSLPKAWPVSAVPDLTVSEQSSTYAGQATLFCQTFVEFFARLFTRQPMKGWGCLVGWAVTCASAATHSLGAWCSSFGVVMIGLGAINLLPTLPFNGGHIALLCIERVTGPLPEPVLTTAAYAGLLLGLLCVIVMVCFDVSWAFSLLTK